MSFVVNGFNDDSKWTVHTVGSGVVLNRTPTSVQLQVNAPNDWTVLRSLSPFDIIGLDVSVFVDNISYACGIRIHQNDTPNDNFGYGIERSLAYGAVVWHGGGAAWYGPDPVLKQTPEELRIRVTSDYIIHYYLNGVEVYSESTLGWVSNTVYVAIYAQPNRPDGTANPGTNTAQSAYAPSLAISVAPTSARLQVGEAVTFQALASGGTAPYSIKWIDDSNNTQIGADPNFVFSTTVIGNYSIHAEATDGTGATAKSYSVPIAVAAVSPLAYPENAVWIQNEGWPAMNPNILTTNLPKVVNDLKNNNINYAFVFVGYWSSPATINYQHPDAYYTNVINALHAAGIKAIAWAEAYNNPMDITVANRNNLYNAIVDCMNRCPWDGYNDDIEPPYIGTLQDQIDFLNGLTPILHNLGKLNMPDVPYDWEQNINQYLYVDFIVTMFYGGRSTFEDPAGPLYFQENFGQYLGHNTPPASPLILGVMNYYGNQYPLAWQLNELGKYMSLYGHPQLVGFSLWLYEYIGTTPDDWTQWNYWITRIGTTTPPVLRTISVDTSPPLPARMSLNGVMGYTPNNMYSFTGKVTVVAPSEVDSESHSVIIGASDHAGGAEGYNVYAYASGPYELSSPVTVNAIHLYTPVAGNVKVAIYGSRNYVIPGWVGVNEHPDQLLTQSQPMTCTANSWNLVSIPSVTLPAGYYFIVIKGDTTGIIGVSGSTPKQVEGQAYGYDQWITQSYSTAFNQTFPQPEGAMQNDASVYVPAAPILITPYYFSHWEDGSTSLTRTINIVSDQTLIAYYTALPLPTHALSISATLPGIQFTLNGVTKTTPYVEILPEGNYTPVMPSNLVIGSDTYNFTQWADGPTSPTRTIQLTADTPLTAIYTIQAPPPPTKGNIEVHAFLDMQEVVAPGLVVETGETFNTPATLPENLGIYVVKVTIGSETKQQIVTVLSEQTIRLDFQFTTPPPTSPNLILLLLGGILIGGAVLSSEGEKRK